MRSGFRSPAAIGAILAILIMAACSPMAPWRARPPAAPTASPLTEAETVAGEIMAYLIEVVLGRSGPPEGRAAWATRGSTLPLDFALVKRHMFGPVPQRAELMVLDTNILGLSQVMYHYDRRLNLFKGASPQDSLYPCAELMAMRLLLMRKLNRGERIGLAAIARYKTLFTTSDHPPDGAALAATHLSAEEFHFLREIFRSEPAFWRYMQHPFIVQTLKRIGAVEHDLFTLQADLAATYRSLAALPAGNAPPQTTIAILPSMTALFDVTGGPDGPLHADPEYDLLLNQLQAAIRTGIARRCAQPGGSSPPPSRLAFFSPRRPMVVHPQNAGPVIQAVCPDAAFTVILLGKNVYRAITIDPARDIFPHARRIYLDVDDIRYQGIGEAIGAIVEAVGPH